MRRLDVIVPFRLVGKDDLMIRAGLEGGHHYWDLAIASRTLSVSAHLEPVRHHR